jgi:hypothetical protein
MDLSLDKDKKPSSNFKKYIAFGILIVLIIITSIIAYSGIQKSTAKAYEDEFDKSKKEYSDKITNSIFNMAESANHVSNDVTIQIESVKEVNILEVLTVNDIEYVIYSDDKTDAWLEVPGIGIYTVDLSDAEFIIDNERQYVLVRAPRPKVNNVTINYNYVKTLLVNEGIDEKWGFLSLLGNGSIQKGEELANNQLKEAQMLLKENFEQNENYNRIAECTAKRSIKEFVKKFNKDVEITVDVEFFDV